MMNIIDIRCNPVMDERFEKRVADANAYAFAKRRQANRTHDILDEVYADAYEQALRDLGVKSTAKASRIF